MIKLANKYFILLIPFQEKDLYKEHFHSFDYDFFPINIQNHELVHYKEIDKLFFEAGGYFVEEQILIVYANSKNLDINKFSLEQLTNNYFNEFKLVKRVYENKMAEYAEKLDVEVMEYEEKLDIERKESELKLDAKIMEYEEKLDIERKESKLKLDAKIMEYEKKLDVFYNKLNYYQEDLNCLKKKQRQRISKLKSLEEDSKYIKTHLKIIANTRPYRIAYFLRRFSHEFLKGGKTNKKNFLKWIWCKFTKKTCGLEFRYNPILELIKK